MTELGDPARLRALDRTRLMDSGAEEVFDRLARLAARLLGTPISMLTLLDGERQHVKGANGDFGEPVPAADSYCQYVVRSAAPFTVTDVREDPRVENIEALEKADLIAYCGVPLVDADGETLGTLCAMDNAARQWSDGDVALLREIADGAMTEIRLRLANERLTQMAGIVDAADEAINLVDLDGCVTEWNPACERLYGWSAEEVVGRPLTEVGVLVEDTDDQGGFALDARALAGESVAAHRLRRRRRDGTIIHVDISLSPLRDSVGRVTGVTAIARDVTDRHRLLTELAASEERFRRTFDNAPEGVTIMSPAGVVLEANRAFCEMLGMHPDDLAGVSLAEFTHEDDLDRDLDAVRALIAGESSCYVAEKRYRHRLGHLVIARITASLVRDADGAPLHFIAHTQDVTATRAARIALQEARELLDESQAIARVGSWSYDLGSGALGWSREQFRLHGFAPADETPTIDAVCESLVPEDRKAFRRLMASVISRPREIEVEYRVALADGSTRTLAASAQPLAADPARGRGARISGTTRDVTAERAAQAERNAIEQRHRRLLQVLPDTMVILYDTDSRVVSMQGGLIAEAGIDPEQFVGRTMSEVITSEQSEVLPALLRRALGGESITIDHDTGQGRQFQIEFAPYTDEDATITGALTVWRDITTRLAGETENRMLATMVEQSIDSFIAKDAEGRITEWRGGAEQTYGFTREEAVGRLLRDLVIPPELHQTEIEVNARVMAGEKLQMESRRRRKDGTELHVALSVSPLRDAAGDTVGINVVARDITERVAAQAARREIEERLRVTVEHAPIGVALVDLSAGSIGRLASVNGAFAALLPDADPAGAGLALTSVIHPDDVPLLRADLAELACDENAHTNHEVRCLHPDGRVIWLLVTGAAVPSETGAPHLAVLHAMDIGERKRFEGQLQHLADHDTLTGLFNRRRFEAELTRAVSVLQRYGGESALLMVDLDGFKHVNDTLGHSYGDELITRVASCLRGCLRDTDVIGRLGGDEFAIILTSTPVEAAVVVAEKLLAAVTEHGTVVAEHRHASVTASIGIAAINGARRLDAEALLVEADLAMYSAKEAGRNQVALAEHADGDEEPTLAVQRSWLTRLRGALDNDEFELHAQPIRGICAESIEAHELLLRLRGEDGELIAPATFLHNAERFDLIQEIDRWVFGQALQLLSGSHAAGRDVSLSVNMSGKTLNDPRLVDDLAAMIEACPIPRDRLVVEVTETAAIVNIDRAREVARALRELGCRFALDDFGAGFACFYYLKHLDFDYVKIDGEFVRALGENRTDSLVIASIVALAQGLGAETIAEFVGDDDAVDQLRALGVDYGQGFHLGRPAPARDVLSLVSPARGT